MSHAPIGALGGFLAIAMLALLTSWTSNPWIMAPFGASCVLAFGIWDAPFSRPRNIVGGHLITTLSGIALFHLFGQSVWVMAAGVGLAIGLMMLTFVIPVQVVMIPLFLLFQKYGMLGSPLPFIVPALFAGGIKSVLFILIYTQFFRTIPKALEESAQLDGAGALNIFVRIILPITVPAVVVVFLFSLVWHWNETYTASLYLRDSMRTLPMMLQAFEQAYSQMYSSSSAGSTYVNINESIKLAGTMLIILPLLILYLFAQRWFVEVIDRTGITGE